MLDFHFFFKYFASKIISCPKHFVVTKIDSWGCTPQKLFSKTVIGSYDKMRGKGYMCGWRINECINKVNIFK